jgi:hypothetical protein
MRNVKLRALVWAEMIAAGIVPMDPSNVGLRTKTSPALEGLSEEDSRRLKRKFRKLWRRLRGLHRLVPGEPSGAQMQRRKNAVLRRFCSAAAEEIKKSNPGFDEYSY